MSEANVAAWAVAGAALGAYDGYKYAKNKNLKGWKKAAAIVGGAVIGAVNPFKVVKAVKTVSKVYKASKYTKAATSAKKTATAAKKVTAKPKQTVVAKKSTQTAVKTSTAKKTAQTVKAEQKTAKAACFTAGTKIHTEKGFKNIEAFKAGDYVWSENPETKEKALKKVKKIFVREKDSIIRLAINEEVIETTDEHPFYVEGRGFTAAGELKAGDEVRLESGEEAFVESIEEIQLSEPVKVYNFEVEDFHTYYVSEQKVLVHNTCMRNTVHSSETTKVILPNKPHVNKTEGHWETILSKVDELRVSGDYSKIYVNKGIRNEIKTAKINRRPDIMAVKRDGTIDQFEIPSKTDVIEKLRIRMSRNSAVMGNRAGNNTIVPIMKE